MRIVQNLKFKIQNYSSKFKISNFKLQLFTFNFALLIFILILKPASAQTTNCTTTVPRAEGLVTSPQQNATTKFGTTSGACVTDPKAGFAPFKVPTYDDLKSIYYDQSKAAKITTLSSISGSTTFSGSSLYYVNGDLTVSGTPTGSGTQVIFVNGKLNITSDYTYGTAITGTVFIVKGDVNISYSPTIVTTVNAVIVSSGVICTAFDGISCPLANVITSPLTINGSLVSLNDTAPIKFRRSLTDNSCANCAAEKVNNQVKYLVALKDLFSSTLQKWSEVTGPYVLATPQPTPTPTPTPTFPTSGLAAYWKLDEYPGSGVAKDSAGPADGAVVGASFVGPPPASKIGNAASFNGSGNYLGVTSTGNIPINNSPYAISAWFKPVSAGVGGIIGWGAFGFGDQANALRLAADVCSGSWGLINYWWGPDLKYCPPAGTNWSTNWHHVVAQFDGTTRSIYLDGGLVASDSPTGHSVPNASNFRIGSTNGGEYFNGSLDEIGIWNRALSAQEISNLYNSGAGFTYTPVGIFFDYANSQTKVGTNNISWEQNTGYGANRIMIVAVSIKDDSGVSSISYPTTGQGTFNLIGKTQGGGPRMVEMWYMLNPPTCSSNPPTTNCTVTVNFPSNSGEIVGGSTTWSGVRQTAPTGSFPPASNAQPSSLSISNVSGDVVVDAIEAQGLQPSLAPAASQTLRWNQLANGFDSTGAGSSMPGGTSPSMSWTGTSSGTWALGAAVLKPYP